MAFVDLPHKDAIVQHATRRLFERCGIAITVAELRALNAKCADGTSPAAARARAGGTLHLVKVRDSELWAVFRPELGAIVTFLPGVPVEVRA